MFLKINLQSDRHGAILSVVVNNLGSYIKITKMTAYCIFRDFSEIDLRSRSTEIGGM